MASAENQKEYDVELENEAIGAEDEGDLDPKKLKRVGEVVVTGPTGPQRRS